VFVNIYIFFRRQHKSLVEPVQSKKRELKDKYNKQIKSQISGATRHIFLIRHGQYNLSGETDGDRKLTELGMYLISMNYNKCLCPNKMISFNENLLLSDIILKKLFISLDTL